MTDRSDFLSNLAPADPSLPGLLTVLDWRWHPDARDYPMTRLPGVPERLAFPAAVPEVWDDRTNIKAIYDQDGLGACVAASDSAMMSLFKQKEHSQWITFDWRKFYAECGGVGNSGLDPRQAIQRAQKTGIPDLQGRYFRVGAYTLEGSPNFSPVVRAAIAAGYCVTMAFLVPSGNDGWNWSGQMTQGYHQVMLCGYGTDPTFGRYLMLANSWTDRWGNRGFGRIPESYLLQQNMQGGYCFFLTVTDYLDDGLGPPPPPPGSHLISAYTRTSDGKETTTGTLVSEENAAVALTRPDGRPAAPQDDELLLVNQQRAANGAGPLVRNTALDAAAQGYAEVLAAGAPFSHTGPDGSTPYDRTKRAGYPGSYIGENIAKGYSSVTTVMDAWMNSAGHKANLLNPNFKEIGIGIKDTSYVQDFGWSSTPPPPQPPAAETIDHYADMAGHPITQAVYGQQIQIIGTFLVDTQAPAVYYANLTCPVGPNKSTTAITVTLPTFANGADYQTGVLIVHAGKQIRGPVLFVKNPVPRPLLSVASLTFSPISVAPGAWVTGTVVLSDRVPVGQSVVLPIASSRPEIAMPLSPNIVVYAGSDRATFPVQARASGAAQITVSLNNSSQSATVSVSGAKPPPTPTAVHIEADVSLALPGQITVGQKYNLSGYGTAFGATITKVTEAPAPPTPPDDNTQGPKISAIDPPHARVGQPVTILGQGFDTQTRVVFTRPPVSGDAGVVGTVQNVSGTSIRVVVPPTAITGDVFVRRGSDRLASNRVLFTVDTDSSPPDPPKPAPDDTDPPIPANAIHITPGNTARLQSARGGDFFAIHGGIYSQPLPIVSGAVYVTPPGEKSVFQGGGGGRGVEASGIVGALLHGIGFQGWHELGTFQGCKNLVITQCSWEDGGTSGPWFAGCDDVLFLRCTVRRCGNEQAQGDNGIALDNCRNFRIERCEVSQAIYAGIQVFHTTGLALKDCWVHHCRGSGIICKRDLEKSLISGCKIEHSAWSSESAEAKKDAGLQLEGNDNLVENCLIVHCGSGLFLTVGELPLTCNRNTIRRITVVDSEEAGIDLAGYDAGQYGRLNDNLLQDNIVVNAPATLRLQLRGHGTWGNQFVRTVCWGGPVQALEGSPPPVDMVDPRLDASFISRAFPDRGWKGLA